MILSFFCEFTFSKVSFMKTARVTNSLNPDQTRCFVELNVVQTACKKSPALRLMKYIFEKAVVKWGGKLCKETHTLVIIIIIIIIITCIYSNQ